MATKFDKPYLEKSEFDKFKIGEMFNLASNFDLEGLRRHSLVEKIPFNILNENNDNLIHITVRTSGGTIEEKRLKIIKYLVSKGLNPDLPNNQGVTPLHLACEKQYSEIIVKLLEFGSDPNSKDNYGRTPIHYLVSGLIKEWENKENKPLFYGTREKQPKNLFKSKVEFKNKIYELIQPKVRDILDINIGRINEQLNGMNILKDFKLKDTLSLSDQNEKLKTKIKEFKDSLEEAFSFNEDNLYSSDESKITKNSVKDIIERRISENKDELKQNISELSEKIKINIITCQDVKEKIELTYKDKRGTDKIKNKKDYLLNKISPFYPYLFKDSKDTYHFVSNGQTGIEYKPYPNLVDLIRRVNGNNFSIIYYWFTQTFKNQKYLVDVVDLPIFVDGEPLESIKSKLETGGLIPNDTNSVRLQSMLLLTLTCAFYNPNELKNVPKEYIFDAERNLTKYNFLKSKIVEMRNNIPGFFLEVFYFLFEYDLIDNNGEDKIYNTNLHLIRLLMESKQFLEIEGQENLQGRMNDLTKYDLFNIDDTKTLKNMDKIYLETEGIDKDKTKSLLKHNDNYLTLIESDDYKKLLGDETDIGDIFNNNNFKIYYSKIFKWIPPVVQQVLGHHYLSKKMDKYSLNQAFYIKKILGVNFLGDFNIETELVDTITTENPEYTIPAAGAGVGPKRYLVKPALQVMMEKTICNFNNVFSNLLYNGKYPLIKIFNLDDKFNQYFNRVIPYHIKFLSSVTTLVNSIGSEYKLFTKDSKEKVTLNYLPNNYNKNIKIIDLISKLNYLLIRMTTKDETLRIPNFYFYGFEEDLTSYRILSYGNVGEKDLEDDDDDDELINPFLKGRINTEKLRISKTSIPDSLYNQKGLNMLINYGIINSLPDYTEEIDGLISEMLKQMKLKVDIIDIGTRANFLNKVVTELINDIYSKYLDLQVISYLQGTKPDLRALITPIKEQTEMNTDFLKSTDLKFSITKESRKVSLFPIVEKNKKPLPELYFSNDYTSDEFVNKLFEIKYNDNSLREIIKYGGNPFIVDFSEQSPIHLITTNYLVKPYQTLTELGVDLRQKDENGFDFNKKVGKELDYHKSFIKIEQENSFRTSINELINPFLNDIKSKIDKSSLTGFNKLRYTRLALELPIYYLLANEDIIDKLPSKIYPSDLVLAKHLVNPKTKTPKTNIFNKPTGNTIVEKHQNFLDTFFDSPGVFINEFEIVLSNEKNNNLISLDNISEDDVTNYFISDKLITNKSVKKVYDILELVTKQILTTQIIYLLTNMINAHLKIKYPTLGNGDRARIIEDDILGKIVTRGEDNQNLLDIIKNEALPKLLRTTIEFYLDDIDKNEVDEYSVYDLTSEIKSVLKLHPKWFDSKDRLLDDVIPNFLNGYMEIYLPEVIRNMRCIVENVLKLKINHEKVKKLKTS